MTEKKASDKADQVERSDSQWREQLSPEAYQVCRQQGTEQAFAGEYWDCKTTGTYSCRCCGAELFHSGSKYDSGTGWPSFWKPKVADNVGENVDSSHGMRRVEVVCSRCNAHLGHLFPDGPQPTGQRYCINSLSLELEPEE
jgi:peptide-methionine (R)-S-oxide reductase